MTNNRLNPKILKHISEKSGLKESTVRKNISILRRDFPSCTLNAVAQLYAKTLGFSLMHKLGPEDKASLPHNIAIPARLPIANKKINRKEVITEIIKYKTNDYFILGHINELNRAYTKKCFTSVLILARKIIENLIREILSDKYPSTSKENKKLYFDISQNRFKDFSVILKNLYNKRDDFGIEKSKIIERLYQKAIKFKDDSNDKVHSWYHLVENKSEVDNLNLQYMIELIKKLENNN